MSKDDDHGLKFAANLKWLFAERPLEERFAAAAAGGFQAVEYPTPYDWSIKHFASIVEAHNLKVVLINTPTSTSGNRTVTGIACDPSQRQAFRDGVEKGLEYASALGVDLLHVVGGPIPQGVSKDRAWNEYVLNIAWAGEMVHDSPIRVLIEPQNQVSSPGFILRTQAQAVALIEAIGLDHLKLLFDVYHVQVEEGNVTKKLREFAPYIGHVQIADSPDRTEPGLGELAWPYIFGELQRMQYDGWIGCEYKAITSQGSTLQWLRKVGAPQ